MSAQHDEIKESTSEVDDALSIFERLSLSPCKMKKVTYAKENAANSFQHSGYGKKEENTCKRYIRFRNRPYVLPLYSKRAVSPKCNSDRSPNSVDTLKSIRLIGCDFKTFSTPLFPPMSSGKKEAKPCWLQHEQTVGYSASNKTRKNDNKRPKPGSNTSSHLSAGSPSSSDSELNFEIDELSEYFQHFVNVRLKMSFQAESMYV